MLRADQGRTPPTGPCARDGFCGCVAAALWRPGSSRVPASGRVNAERREGSRSVAAPGPPVLSPADKPLIFAGPLQCAGRTDLPLLLSLRLCEHAPHASVGSHVTDSQTRRQGTVFLAHCSFPIETTSFLWLRRRQGPGPTGFVLACARGGGSWLRTRIAVCARNLVRLLLFINV